MSLVIDVRTIAFLVVAVALAGLAAVSPKAGITVLVTTMMFSATARRLFPAPNQSSDIAGIFPHIVAAPLAWRGIRHRPPSSVILLLLWAGVTVLLHFGTPLIGLAGLLNFGVPLLVALGVATIPNGNALVRRAFTIFGSLAATYAVTQYFVPFSWDRRWQESAHFLSAGKIGTVGFRPYGTLPAPGTMAIVAAIVFLLVVLPSSPVSGMVRVWAGATSGLVVMLSQVRSVWIALLAAVLVFTASERGRASRTIAAIGLSAIVLVALVPGKTTLLERAQSFSSLNNDPSFSSRRQLVRQIGALATPLGRGVGQLSAGSRVRADTSVDNGYVVVLGETGLIGLALFICVLGTTSRRATRSDYPFLVMLLVVNGAGFAVGGIAGIVLWSTSGLQRPPPTSDTDPQYAAPVGSS